MPLKVVRCLSSELINQVVVVARIAVDGAAHSQGLAACKTLPAGQAQFGHEVEIGRQFAAGAAEKDKGWAHHCHQAQEIYHAEVGCLAVVALLGADVGRVEYQ